MAAGLTDEEVLALAELSEEFYKCGVAPEDSPLRKQLAKMGQDNTACGLLFLTHVIFREYYIRGLHHD